MTRKIIGNIIFPSETPSAKARRVVVELRDVTLADASSVVVAKTELKNVEIASGAHIAFALNAPMPAASQSLDLWAHVDLSGAGRVMAGDYCSTASHPVPSSGSSLGIDIYVRKV